jgi:hypothetical protein
MSGKDVLLAIVIPLLLAELAPWCGWLAGKLIPYAARLRYGASDRAAVRAEEWLSDLDNIPGQLSKLAYAVGQLLVGSMAGMRRQIERTSLRDDTSRAVIYRLRRTSASGALLSLIVLAYQRNDPRRMELLAELYAVPKLERLFWVFEQLEVALLEVLSRLHH